MRLTAAPRLRLLPILVGIAVMVAAFALYSNARTSDAARGVAQRNATVEQAQVPADPVLKG